MAGAIHRLTAIQIKNARKAGRIADGGGLYLRISKAGTKSFSFQYSWRGKRQEIGLGSAGASGLTLAQARAKAQAHREALAEGRDPKAERRAVRSQNGSDDTFGGLADAFVADHRDGWSNAKHADQWAMTLGDAYCKDIRPLPVQDITVDDILAVLRPHWMKKPETARRVRMRIERILDVARVRGLRDGPNPATWRGNLDLLLPKQPKTRGHHAAMAWADVPGFFEKLSDREGIAALALRFTILTAGRTGEIIGARWDEIDIEAATWSIPSGRMKARRPHRVPLSDPALEVLGQVEGLSEEWVFPNKRATAPLSNMAMLTLLRRMKVEGATPHGFRSSFRDWTAEATNFPGEIAEMALAHVIANNTEAAYRRGDLFDRRRTLMDAWGNFLSNHEVADVIPMTVNSSDA